jgi:type VI secretion system protein ImpJ
MSSPLIDRRASLDRRKRKLDVAAGDLKPGIKWQEGMLLAPQHFQLLDRRHEELIHYHAAATSPYHWGIAAFEYDKQMLMKGAFRVSRLEAIMPDGLVVAYDPHKDGDLSAPLPDAEKGPVTISLVVAEHNGSASFRERYHDNELKVIDENTDDADITFDVLRPRLLLRTDEPPKKYTHFPLAKIDFQNNQHVVTTFEPPQLRVTPGSYLHRIGTHIARALRRKALVQARLADAPATAMSDSQLLGVRSTIHYLVAQLPVLEALLDTGTAHPFSLYLVLCSIAGHVSALSRSLMPPHLGQYDHDDLTATFEAVELAITSAIDEGVAESYTEYRFIADRDEFRIKFDPIWKSRDLFIGVRAPSGVTDSDMADWVSTSVIGGRASLIGLRDRRVTGVRRRRIDSDADLVPSRGVTLFSITAEDFVIGGEELVILSPRDEKRARPEEIVLYVKNPAPVPDGQLHVSGR